MAIPLFNIGGLASGLDTNAIIEGIIQAERIPIQQLESRKAGYEAKDKAWQEVTTRFSAIRTALDKIDAASDFSKFALASSSNEDIVGASVTGSAAPATLTFTVSQLAATHQIAFDHDFAGASDLVGAGDVTITVNGEDHVITTTASTTVADLAAAIDELDLGITARVISLDGVNSRLMLSADESGAANAFTVSSSVTDLQSVSIVEQGADAQLTLGSGPGALTVTRPTNTITDLVAGVSIDLQQVSTDPVTVSIARDADAAVEAMKSVVDEVNAALNTLAEYTKYNPESETGGPLVGDSTARNLVMALRTAISGTVNDASPDYPLASSIGISLQRDGTFSFNETKFRDALADDWDQVVDLMVQSGHSLDTRMSYVGSSAETVEGAYEVVVTQAATRPSALSNKYKKPKNDTTFQIVVGSTSVDVTVQKDANVDASVDVINAALTAAGVTSVTASKVTFGNKKYIQLDGLGYGSSASFQVVGDPFGLDGTYTGTDVAGTIGGQPATGAGQVLTADSGDPQGLVVKVMADQAAVDAAGGSLSLGALTYSKGITGTLDTFLESAEGVDGSISRARDRWKAQIDLIDDRIEVLEDRLDRKEALLIKQFAALETAMAQLQQQGNWLSSQLGGMQAAPQ